MRIFSDNIHERYERYKAAIGYAILCVGVIIAITFAFEALNKASEQDEITRGVICQNTIVADRQMLTNLVTKSGHELLASFHLTPKAAAVLIHKSLEASAAERKTLQPSKPASACTEKITTLPFNPKTSPESKEALAIASKPAVVHKLSTPLVPAPTTTAAPKSSSPKPSHPSAPVTRPTPVVPRPHPTTPTAPRVNPPAGVTPPPVATPTPPRVPPVPPITTPAPAPPLVKVPPVTVGPVTTPEVKVTTPEVPKL